MINTNLKEKYVNLAKIQMACSYSGEYRKGNRASSSLRKINRYFNDHFEENEETINALMRSENPNVVIWISDVLFERKTYRDFMISKLQNFASDTSLGIIRLNAEMMLKAKLSSSFSN